MDCHEMRGWLEAGDSRSWDDAARGECSTQCLLFSVYACTRWMLYLVLTLDQCMERYRGMT